MRCSGEVVPSQPLSEGLFFIITTGTREVGAKLRLFPHSTSQAMMTSGGWICFFF